jgi:formylglycine-generating enzyme required for sulfatase activity
MIRIDHDPTQKPHRVLRGGSFISLARNVRSAYRFDGRPDVRLNNYGLRPAMEIKRIEK